MQRGTVATIGVMETSGLEAEEVNLRMADSPRGFYSGIVDVGRQCVAPAIQELCAQNPLRVEFERTSEADKLFGNFGSVSRHQLLGLGLSVYPGLATLDRMRQLYPEHAQKISEVTGLLERNMSTPPNEQSPVTLREDHPGWATEKPDIRNLRGEMSRSVAAAVWSANEISRLIDAKYGNGTMGKIKNIVVLGIGANDMYLKDLPLLVNQDPASQRKLYSVFEPSQLDSLPDDVSAENTLFLAISRGGGTQETLKSMEFAAARGKMKYLVTFSNKGLVWSFNQKFWGVAQSLENKIGGRYMWAKGKIVLVPLALCASREALDQYTGAMVSFDNQFWPVGKDLTILQLASHLYAYTHAYNIPGLFACSNNEVLDAGLRQLFQLHNEAVGKIINRTIAYGAGMEMLPFAHAGADGILGSAISAHTYGAFIFDSSHKLSGNALTESDLVKDFLGPDGKPSKGDLEHLGLTPELLKMACVFPNQAKFTFAGGPNFMLTMDGVNYGNLATLTAFYQNLMYPYLIMNGTNPDSNPNVDMVRKTTGGLITGLLTPGEGTPIEVIQRLIPKIMR